STPPRHARRGALEEEEKTRRHRALFCRSGFQPRLPRRRTEPTIAAKAAPTEERATPRPLLQRNAATTPTAAWIHTVPFQGVRALRMRAPSPREGFTASLEGGLYEAATLCDARRESSMRSSSRGAEAAPTDWLSEESRLDSRSAEEREGVRRRRGRYRKAFAMASARPTPPDARTSAPSGTRAPGAAS